MGLIGLAVFAVLALLAACLPRLLTDEFKAWVPWLVEKMISRAVNRAPPHYRQRLAEEWRSHANETPGSLGKLWFCSWLPWASGTLIREAPHAAAEVDNLGEPTEEEILASIRRVIAEAEETERLGQESAATWMGADAGAWPPVCNLSTDGRHRVLGVALHFSTVYGGKTFQGYCEICRKWVDTGDYPD